MKKSSIGSWAYNIGPYAASPIPFDTVCETLASYGFDGVELGGFNKYPNPNDLPQKEQRQELVAKMKKWGLEFSGFAADLWGQKLINTDDQTGYLNEFIKNCDFAVDVGLKGIRVDCTQPPTILNEVDYETAFKRVAETWKRCADEAAARGLYVTWEFEPGFAFNKPSDILRILDAVNKPNFGVMYDTCHGQMVAVQGARQFGAKETLPGGQLELIAKLSGRINHVHVIDSDNTCHQNDQGQDETSAHVPLGEGVLNFDEIMPALAKEQLPHDFWTIDLCFWPEAWPKTQKCKAALDALIDKYGGGHAARPAPQPAVAAPAPRPAAQPAAPAPAAKPVPLPKATKTTPPARPAAKAKVVPPTKPTRPAKPSKPIKAAKPVIRKLAKKSAKLSVKVSAKTAKAKAPKRTKKPVKPMAKKATKKGAKKATKK